MITYLAILEIVIIVMLFIAICSIKSLEDATECFAAVFTIYISHACPEAYQEMSDIAADMLGEEIEENENDTDN